MHKVFLGIPQNYNDRTLNDKITSIRLLRGIWSLGFKVTGKQLMLQVAELVRRNPGRTKKQDTSSATSQSGPSKSGGKGGKKRK
ncbi:hypothetical protein Sjap_024664 [Stephania japonica]|uniref:Uncharacterized protein n=1 Tax=Stephania japonica TaxID=461633 RepID=A0AAP0EIN6_9MAGN